MVFSDLRFLLFFVLAFGLYWTTRRNTSRKLVLLAASYAFYAAWDWRFLSLIWISTAVDFSIGLALDPNRSPGPRARKQLLALSLVVNLGILAFFKYFGFFVESAAALSADLGLPVSIHSLDVILPLGISFYTFQTLSYSIDVYRGELEPTPSLLDFALFVGFFPQLVAGPIVRASLFLPQLKVAKRFSQIDFRACLVLFLIGLIKKACIADRVATVVDLSFANPEALTLSGYWLVSFLYSIQIYCDFSGYSDMAIATAGLLGFRLPENFAFPYLATSMRDFWQRWHISLSSWFRDYLYIPLGGNRGSRGRVAVNLGLVFLLCGLWHGANWTFVVWGLYHGAFLSLERFLPVERLPRPLGHLYVVAVFSLGFLIFRSPDLATAIVFLAGSLDFTSMVDDTVEYSVLGPWWLLVVGFAVVHVLLSRFELTRRFDGVPASVFALGLGVVVALVMPWVVTGYRPFIYFQF
jgi:alginate O-acetyltransferase complex protein AlgI